MPEGIIRKYLYGVFGSRESYLNAPEDEVFEQGLIWEGENAASKIQREQDEEYRKRIEEQMRQANANKK